MLPLIAAGGRIAGCCELLDIAATRLHADLFLPPGGSCAVAVELEPGYSRNDDFLVYQLNFRVSVDRESERVAQFDVCYLATFKVPGGFQAEPDEYASFGGVTVTMAVFPYLREYIHSTGARLGLDNLLLGVVKMPAAATLQTLIHEQSDEPVSVVTAKPTENDPTTQPKPRRTRARK